MTELKYVQLQIGCNNVVNIELPGADAQADLSLRWAHTHFVGFDMSRLIS